VKFSHGQFNFRIWFSFSIISGNTIRSNENFADSEHLAKFKVLLFRDSPFMAIFNQFRKVTELVTVYSPI